MRTTPLRELATALAVAIAAWALSCLVEPARSAGFSFGLTYQAMAERPFAFEGLFPHRILLPLLAHLTGLTGERFHLVPHACAVLLLALVHWGARRQRASSGTAVLVTLAAALGGATQLYKSHVGYPDSLSFVCLLGAALAVRHGAAFWAINLLSAFAHEQVFFFVPFLLLLRRRLGGARWTADAAGLLVLALAYGAFRAHVSAHAAPQAIAPGYYFGNGYFPLGFLGVLYLAMVQAVLAFGATLPVLAWATVERRVAWERQALLLFLGGILGIYLVAHDFNRFVNFLFLPLAIASLRFLAQPGRWPLFAGMLLVQAAVTRWLLMPVTEHFFAPMVECGLLVGVPSELAKLVTYVLPRVWPAVAGFLLALLLLLGAGVWLARGDGRGRSA